VVKKYRPDFIVKLKSGEHLILETKGQPSEKDKAKAWISGRMGAGGEPTRGIRHMAS